MKHKSIFIAAIVTIVLVPSVIFGAMALLPEGAPLSRPEGPCDIYAAAGDTCATAHSTTRALYSNYDGPLYQVMRQSDGKTLDIGVVAANSKDHGGYADAAAQDEFCKDTYCWITIIYDQSGNENHLRQAPRGGFSGNAMGGANNISLADWAPVTIYGHKVYGVFITAGMGYRWNDAKNTAVDDQAEGQYWVINGHHYNNGCCFDYGNAETDSRDDGDGTMETTYYGNQTGWYHGERPGPWVMTDQENNLVGCVNPDPNDKFCKDLMSIPWRFVTAMADGEPHHWRSMGGDAQQGGLITMYDGGRIKNSRSSYDPMRKQGAVLLGNGGDNSIWSAGTFYEGAMTMGGTFPTVATNEKIQANIVSAHYDVASLTVSATDKTFGPSGLQTFYPGSTQFVTATFVNTTDTIINDLEISLELPSGWKASVYGTSEKSREVAFDVAPGQTVITTFNVTSSSKEFEGDLVATASWTKDKSSYLETALEKVRNVQPVKINEFRISAADNKTNSFIELYNAGDKPVDLSSWNVATHAVNLPSFSTINIPDGTKLAPNSFYLIGMANSGLAVEAKAGDKTIYVSNVNGIEAGDEIKIGDEKAKVVSVKNESEKEIAPTTIWQPLPEGPVIKIAKGSNNIPVTSVNGVKEGMKIAIGYGATYPTVGNTLEKYEVVTVTSVGKPGTQAYLAMDAKPGDTNIKLTSTENISVGDKIRLDINSKGHGIEWVTVKSVGTPSSRFTGWGPLTDKDDPGTGVDIEEPLKFFHSSNMPFSANGTGITFEPAVSYDHFSNEPVMVLACSIELEKALSDNHNIDEPVYDSKVVSSGYQGEVKPDLLFGGPVFSSNKGSIILTDAAGNTVDAVNYGGLVDPWAAEGYQGKSGLEEFGNYAKIPFLSYEANTADLSAYRFPDGKDADDNKADFKVQTCQIVALDVAAGETTILVSSTDGFSAGQKLFIGNQKEECTLALIGTAGVAKIRENAGAGATKIGVDNLRNFKVGQEVLVGGKKYEIAKLMPAWGNDALILASPLKSSVSAGDVLSGTGITLAAPLKSNYPAGTFMSVGYPTPGGPNL